MPALNVKSVLPLCDTGDGKLGTNGRAQEHPEIPSTEQLSVPRSIGLVGGVSFIVGGIIGSGIFVSPVGIARNSGSVGMAMISWLICGVISVLGAFCYAELGTVIKESGGDYAYLHYAYGSPVSYIFSFILNVLVKPASIGTITLTCAQYITAPFFSDGCGGAPEYIKKTTAIVIVMSLAAINIYSVKLANRVSIVFTFTKVFALIVVITGGLVHLIQGKPNHLSDGFEGTERNPGKIVFGLYGGMWAYSGWDSANYMTEELINPERNLPGAIMIGLPLVVAIYILTNISYFAVLSLEELVASPAVALTWANRVIPGASWLIPVFVGISTFGCGCGSMFTSGRLVFAAARNDHLPGLLAMVHVTKYTPIPAIIVTVIMTTCFIIPSNVDSLISFTSFTSWIFYGLNMVAVIIFRYSKRYRDQPRPVKTPIVVPILACLACLVLVFVPLILSPAIEFLFAIVFVAVGFLFYVPLVHFKIRFNCTKYVTATFQQYLQVFKPDKKLD